MSRAKTPEDRTLLDSIDRWKAEVSRAFYDFEDCEGNPRLRTYLPDCSDGFRLLADTNYIVGWVRSNMPAVNTEPVTRVYEYACNWRDGGGLEGLPSISTFRTKVDLAIVLLDSIAGTRIVKAPDKAPDNPPDGLTVTQAAKRYVRELDGVVTLKQAKARISVSASRGVIKSSGKHKARRIDSDSLDSFILRARNKQLMYCDDM